MFAWLVLILFLAGVVRLSWFTLQLHFLAKGPFS